MADFDAMAAGVVKAAQDFVTRALAGVAKRLDELEGRVTALPVPKDGENGKDGNPGKDGAPGKDADPVHPDTVALLVVNEVSRAVAAIPPARDGERGRDAIQCEPLLGIDEAKSYPRGTYACHRGGYLRSFRTTDPITTDVASAGWAVMAQGIDSETEEITDDGRMETRTTRYTDGRTFERKIARAVVIDRGVWKEGKAYLQGDGVTWGGSFWIAQKETEAKPDAADGSWRLSVKKGRDGKDR